APECVYQSPVQPVPVSALRTALRLHHPLLRGALRGGLWWDRTIPARPVEFMQLSPRRQKVGHHQVERGMTQIQSGNLLARQSPNTLPEFQGDAHMRGALRA